MNELRVSALELEFVGKCAFAIFRIEHPEPSSRYGQQLQRTFRDDSYRISRAPQPPRPGGPLEITIITHAGRAVTVLVECAYEGDAMCKHTNSTYKYKEKKTGEGRSSAPLTRPPLQATGPLPCCITPREGCGPIAFPHPWCRPCGASPSRQPHS